MNQALISELFKKEQEIFEAYKNKSPELLMSPPIPEKDVLSRIGIDISFPPRPQGYIRFYPQDFIVEEVSRNGEISEVELKNNEISPSFPFNLGFNLIKAGLSTLDSLNILAEALQTKIRRITYAGLKDTDALTSQKIIIIDVGSDLLERIKKLSLSNIFLTNFTIEKEFLSPGRLSGNRFFIFIRTKGKVDEKYLNLNLERIKKEGVLNFYFSQRFGEPRFINHILGKLITQGKYREAVSNFLVDSGLYEIPLIKKKREEANHFLGNWEEMKKIFEEFPFTFRNEILLLSYLEKNPNDFLGALIVIIDMTQIFIFAYSSYLFNKILSLNQEGLKLPEEIPLLLSDDWRDWKVYEHWLLEDKTQDFLKNLKPFLKFFKLQKRLVKSRIYTEKILFKIMSEGTALGFSLGKGSYATTFLSNLFEIKTTLPVPEWINEKEYDIKRELGIGSIESVKKIKSFSLKIFENKKKREDL
jgi:TruD family tRNA pseudouridine synthase